MEQALKLALRGKAADVSPNPRVGAVIVKSGKVIGHGFHARFGGPHAEIKAIASVKDKSALRGATLYVTLEPCSTHGKTPPCTDAIIENRFARVVAATQDPNAKHRGKGFKILEKAGIKTDCGLLEERARAVNPSFFKLHGKGLPFITLKMAMSLDGKTATAAGESKWISSPESRKTVARLRGEADAIMVGAQTVRSDDPVLLPDSWEDGRQVYRIAVDPRLSAPEGAKIFINGHGAKTIMITDAKGRIPAKKRKKLEDKGVIIMPALERPQPGSPAPLTPAMHRLAELGISHILCEGGGTLAGALFAEKLVDRVVFFIAPSVIGGAQAPTAADGAGAKLLALAAGVKDMKVGRSGPDIMVEGAVDYPPEA